MSSSYSSPKLPVSDQMVEGNGLVRDWLTDGDAQSAKFTVADVLELDALRDAQVVAGRDGLSRVVTGVNIIEVPDVWQWLQGGEFLLSAAYAWRDEPERLVQLLTKLAEAEVSAVGFKLGRYVEALPRLVLDTADQLAVPVILLPPDVAYREVFEPLYRRLLARPAVEMEPTRHVDRALVRFGLDDQSIEKVAGGLARQICKPVRVVDSLNEVVYFAPSDGVVLRRAFDALDETTLAILDVLDRLHLLRRMTRIEDAGAPLLAAALIVGRRRYGHIMVLSSEPADDARLEPAVAHAAEVVSFLLLKRLAILEGRRQARSLFFESLLSDSLSNEEATEWALTFGLRLSRSCIAVMIGFLSGGDLDADQWNVLSHRLERALGATPRVITADVHNNVLLALIQERTQDSAALLRPVVGFLQAHVGEDRRAVVAAGSPEVGLQGVRRSRLEAMIALETGYRLGRHGLIEFAYLGVERLLSQIPLSALSQGYIESLLGAIEDDDDMLRTLELYLQHGGNKSATAAAVPLHRSSLLYRLKKIERRLGASLDDPEQRHELWLALRLRRVLQRSR